MRKMKRAFTLAIALALTFTLILTGCQKSPSSSSSSKASGPAAVTLKWYFGGTWPQTDQAAVFAKVNVLLKQKINATCNFVPVDWGTYDSKMSVVIASGDNYDVCFTSNWINNYVSNVSKGAFLPLDDMLKTDAPKTFAAVPSAFWDAAKIQGKIYAVVCQQISARCASIDIPKDDATKFGFDQTSYKPGDISSLTPYLVKVHKAEPSEYPAVDLGDVGEYLGQDLIAGWNIPGAINVSDPTMTVINQWDSPGMRSLYATLLEWNKDGLMNVSKEITNTFNTMTDRTGHLQSILMGGTYKPGGVQLEQSMCGYPCVEFPTNNLVLSTGGITATMQAISRTSKNPDRAMQMLELFNNDQDAFMLLNYGIKGTHWDTNSDGFMIAGSSQTKYNPNVPWMFATNYMAVVADGQPKDVWQQTKDANNNAVKSPALGFSFEPTPVKDDIAKCTAIMTQYQRGLELGMYSMAEYDTMISKLNQAGAPAIVAEMQKQINTWKSAK